MPDPVAPLAFAPTVRETDLSPQFLRALRWFAAAAVQHRYGQALGVTQLLVTSGYRPGDQASHGQRCGVDLRGKWIPREDPERRKLQIWLAGLWGEAIARAGFAELHWGFGAYPAGSDDEHLHVDTRPHTNLVAAVWLGRD